MSSISLVLSGHVSSGRAEVGSRRIRATAEAGATALLVQHVGSYDLPIELMETFGTRVLGRTG